MHLATSYKILLAFALALGVALMSVLSSQRASVGEGTEGTTPSTNTKLDEARNKIQHVVVIMQENRSFDSYFGTYPGAEGLPRTEDGEFTVCVPNPRTGGCDKPYHDPALINSGGPHSSTASTADINGGKMDGFIATAESRSRGCAAKYALFVRLIHPQMSWVFTTRGRSPITGPMLSSLSSKITCSRQPFLGACRPIYLPSQGGQLGVHLPEANPPAARTTMISTTT